MQPYLAVMGLGMAGGTIGALIALSKPQGSRSREMVGAAVAVLSLGVFIAGTFLT
jgi:hypothetical protein